MKRLVIILSILGSVNIAMGQQGPFLDKVGSSNILGFMNLAVPTASITIPPFNTSTDIVDGLETSAVRFEIKSNKEWKLVTQIGTITANPLSGGAGPPTINFPITHNHIKYFITSMDDQTYSSPNDFVSTVAQLKTGVKGNIQKTGNSFHLKFRIIPGFLVDPGAYTIPIIFTLSAL